VRLIKSGRLRRNLFIAEAREGITDKNLFVCEIKIDDR
jgi:hypothetical protein